MDIKTIKFIDKYAGKPLCWLLGGLIRKDTSKTAFIQLFGIGETILTLPAIKGYKRKNPKKRITVLCTNRNKEVYEGLDYIDEIRLIPYNPIKILWFMLTHAEAYDEVYDFEEYLNISALVAMFIGRRTIGFDHAERSQVFSKTVYLDDQKHFALNFCDLVGVDYPDELEPIAIAPLDKSWAISNMVGLFPGAAESARWRMWPVERFVQLGNELRKRGFVPVIVLGPHEERIPEYNGFHIFTGNLHELAAFCKQCKYFVSADTGPMHLAACVGTSTISLFGPNTPILWGNFNGWFRKYICIYHKQPCSPCIDNKTGFMGRCDQNRCMTSITVKEVLEAIK